MLSIYLNHWAGEIAIYLIENITMRISQHKDYKELLLLLYDIPTDDSLYWAVEHAREHNPSARVTFNRASNSLSTAVRKLFLFKGIWQDEIKV